MGKGLDKFLNIMRLNDDDYDEDYDDEFSDDFGDDLENEFEDDYEDEAPAPKHRKLPSFRSRANKAAAVTEEAEPVRERPQTSAAPSYGSTASSGPARSASRSKIVPMKQPAVRGSGMEVSIQKPSAFEDSSEICDELLAGKAAIVNLEGIDVDVAQRIIDFVSGACYSMSGNIQKVSSYIFIVTPAGIDISGDMESVLGSGASSKVDMSAFRLNV